MLTIARRNIARRMGSSITTVAIIVLAVGVAVASGATCLSLKRSMDIAQSRLGADIIVLPANVGVSASQTLFTADPVNIYLPETATDIVARVEGVESVTPQFFTQTLNQSCCSILGVTRVLGIDASTDFVIAPWAEEGLLDNLGMDGIIVGSDAPEIVGAQASILGAKFHVVGTLAETGTSVDKTIFMNIDTARKIGSESPYLQGVWENTDPFTSISCVMVKVADGYDADAVSAAIEESYPYASATPTSGVIGGTAAEIGLFLKVIAALVVAVFAIMILALAGRFSALLHVRRREIALLRLLGMSRRGTFGSLALESGFLGLLGGVIGSSAGVVCALMLVNALHDVMALPGSSLDVVSALGAFALGVIFAIAVSLISIAVSLMRTTLLEPQELIGRGDL